MFKRILISSFWALAGAAFAQPSSTELVSSSAEDVSSSAEVVASSSSATVVAASSATEAPKGREVPVRYWINGDSVELEAIFVKIENDTVYLKKPTEAEQKHIDKIADEEALALQESNGQQVADSLEDENDDVDIKKDSADIIMTDAVKDSLAARADTSTAAEAAPVDDGSGDDLETALAKEDTRLKNEEIEKYEKELREREIQDSIAAAKKNPYIKIFRFELKRLYNMEDEVMIDLSLSNYIVPEIKEEIEKDLYPPGKANLLVVSEPEACSLFVNGIPLKIVAPDTIKNIKPGKYTISVMKVLKDVEWWGSAVVRINADSLNKVTIPVVRPSTRLTLNTNPEAVEVYVGKEPSVNRMPDYMTDIVVDNVKPQVGATVFFRKVGYRDTSVTMEIKPYMPNLVYVDMTPVLEDLDFIEDQKAFDKERSQRRIGRGLLWSSIVPILAGGVLWYLAERDWSDAADKKHAYEKLSAFDSDDTRRMVKDNHELNDSGDTKCGVAIGLGALGLGLLTAGIILAF